MTTIQRHHSTRYACQMRVGRIVRLIKASDGSAEYPPASRSLLKQMRERICLRLAMAHGVTAAVIRSIPASWNAGMWTRLPSSLAARSETVL